MQRSRCQSWFTPLVAALLAFPASAQQPSGTITGRVTDRATNQPIAEAQVLVVGTVRGARTDNEGAFRVAGVPAGTYQVRVLRLGYTQQTRSLTVGTGSVEANFTLDQTATQLDQVVISATGESQRRRENGTSTASIDTSALLMPAVQTLSNVLTARAPGLTVQGQSGTTGAASRIRIRGANSISLSNEPLLIVDGVRVSNDPVGFAIGVGGQTISRFDDINPDDIENIEIIKGPAAASLYGTAAANGVIQITTKRGRVGRGKWTVYSEQGVLNEDTAYPANYNQVGTLPSGARVTGCTIDAQARGACVAIADSLLSWNPLEQVSPFRDGYRQVYGLNASGGSDQLTYFTGGEYEREQGVVTPNKLLRLNGRSNMRAQISPTIDAAVSIGYTSSRLGLNYNDNSAFGVVSAGLIGKAFDCSPSNFLQNPRCGVDSLSRGYFTPNVRNTDYFNVLNEQSVERFVGGLNSNWTPKPWLRGVLQAGVDYLNFFDQQTFPANKVGFSPTTLEGSRFNARYQTPTYTTTGTVTANYTLPWFNIQSTSSAGGQFVREEFHQTTASGAILLPGTGSLGGTSARFAVGETNREVITLGAFAQQQFSWNDRRFLTLALRGDDGSTFGADFGLVKYPSASASWVISEEGFFPKSDAIGQLRLRVAYGQSGQRPGFRAAETFFNPVSVRLGTSDLAAVTVGGTGNSLLKPERSSELEGGLEASLFGNRLGAELTLYTKTTQDALVSRILAPSLGVSNSRFDNLGEVKNDGIEALINATLVDLRNVRFEATLSGSANRNKVVKLGQGIAPILFGFSSTQQHRDGYPLGGYFQRLYTYTDKNADGIISRVNCPTYAGVANPQIVGGAQCEVTLTDSVEYMGSPLPTRELNLSTSLTIYRNVRLSTLWNYRGNYQIFNSTREFRCGQFLNCQDIQDRNAPLADQARVIARLMGTAAGYIEDASFVKLREVGVTVAAPNTWARRFNAENMSFTVAGRNLAVWSDYSGFDPEVNSNATGNFTTSDFLAQAPIRYITARLNIVF